MPGRRNCILRAMPPTQFSLLDVVPISSSLFVATFAQIVIGDNVRLSGLSCGRVQGTIDAGRVGKPLQSHRWMFFLVLLIIVFAIRIQWHTCFCFCPTAATHLQMTPATYRPLR